MEPGESTALRFYRALTLVGLLLGLATVSRTALGEEGFEELVRKTEEIRGLEFKREIPFKRMSKADLSEFLKEELARHYGEDTWNLQQKALQLIGAVPEALALDEFLYQLMSEQIAGFYDPHTEDMVVIGNLSLKVGLTQIVLEHELTHALTDQHFDLLSLPIEETNNDDRMLAALCLVEGDATISMAEYAKELDIGAAIGTLIISLFTNQSAFYSSPVYYQASLIFPYLGGEVFLLRMMTEYRIEEDRLVERGEEHDSGLDWRVADYFYKHPPVSTEQVLHPEKLVSGEDPPIEIDFGDAPLAALGEGWSASHENTFGEFLFRTFFLEHLGATQSLEASEGWGGDRYILAEKEDGETALFWRSVWDTEKDALEFRSACLKLIEEEAFGGAVAVLPHDPSTLKEVSLWIFSNPDRAESLSQEVHP
jgi:hypothetical protein